MTELEFKNTDPINYGSGNINLLYSSSIGTGYFELPANYYGVSGSFDYDSESFDSNGNKVYFKSGSFFPPYRILGLNIPFNSANDVSLEQTLSNINKVKFTVGGAPVTVKVTQISKNSGYYFIRVKPKDILTFPSDIDSFGTPTDSSVEFIFDPYLVDKFNNNDYNALIGNASTNVSTTIALEVDRSTDPINPSNLDAIIDKTANPAQLQYSNYTLTGWTNARYEGTKLDSGSIKGDDPAITLKSFKGSLHKVDSDVDTILANEAENESNLKDIYFSDTRRPTDYLRIGEELPSTKSFPIAVRFDYTKNLQYTSSLVNYSAEEPVRVVLSYPGDFVYGEQGNRFVRLVETKIYASDKGTVYTTDEFGRVVLEQTTSYS